MARIVAAPPGGDAGAVGRIGRMKSFAVPIVLALAAAGVLAQGRSVPEPKVQRTVIEDDSVRIEELRVRGLSTSLVVKPKHAAAYEVVPTPGGRDPSQGRGGSQGAAGQRVWHVLKF
jgi:hypothetical protein